MDRTGLRPPLIRRIVIRTFRFASAAILLSFFAAPSGGGSFGTGSQVPSHRLSIFLLTDRHRDLANYLKGPGQLRHVPVSWQGTQMGTLFVRPSARRRASWSQFFQGAADLTGISLEAASTGAVWLIRVAGRCFALSFGYGRHLLKDGKIEERFGLKVVLNSIAHDKLLSMDSRSLDSSGRQVREQATRESDASTFGIDIDRDLLRAATGTPTDQQLGARLSGKDCLTASATCKLADIPDLLRRYLAQYQSTAYQSHFGWVDHIAEVSDKSLVHSLDDELCRYIEARASEAWLAVPEVIDWSDTAGFDYLRKRDGIQSDLYLPHFVDSLREGTTLTVELLKRKQVRQLRLVDDAVANRWSVYDCIQAEVEFNGALYMLSNRRWFRVSKDYVGEVDNYISSQVTPPPWSLPDYNHKTEGDYNTHVRDSDPANWYCLDADNIFHGGGNSQVEFCDLLGLDRTLVYVKRYSGSAPLSHLFAQGALSGELLLRDSAFREKVRKKLSGSKWVGLIPVSRVDPAKFTLVYAIISASQNSLRLPFFSRVTFREAHRRLSGFGYTVHLGEVRNPTGR